MKRLVILLIGIVIVVAVSYVGTIVLHGSAFGFSNAAGRPDYLTMAVATIVGVVAGTLVSGLQQLPADKRVSLTNLVDMMLRPSMLIAFCVSPVVFYVVLVAVNNQETGLLSTLAAFQNGFFWEQVLKRQRGAAAG
jgi:hypothetical protein